MQRRGSQLERGLVIGGYRIDELISRGGMGVVYRATNVALNRIYALKVLAPELADDGAFRERFKREMRIAASISHPNVCGTLFATPTASLGTSPQATGVVYAAELHTYPAPQSPANRSLWLLCHLAGIPVPATPSRTAPGLIVGSAA